MRKRWVTLFPFATEVHFTKDVGQVPLAAVSSGKFQAELATYWTPSGSGCGAAFYFPVADSELAPSLPGVTVSKLKFRGRILGVEFGCLEFLLLHSAAIDVLNLFHLSRLTAISALFFKILNPRGKLYVKADDTATSKPTAEPVSFWRRRLSIFMKIINTFVIFFFADIVSFELRSALEKYSLDFPYFSRKFVLMPNGSDLACNKLAISSRGNYLIVSGRIGAWEKNHELLLAAFLKAKLSNWVLIFLGEIMPAFQETFNSMVNEDPSIASKISFYGPATNRLEIQSVLSSARLYAVSSRYEGASLAAVEALCCGLPIVSTNVGNMQELHDEGFNVLVCDSHEVGALSLSIRESAYHAAALSDLEFQINAEKASARFNWSSLMKEVLDKIDGQIVLRN